MLQGGDTFPFHTEIFSAMHFQAYARRALGVIISAGVVFGGTTLLPTTSTSAAPSPAAYEVCTSERVTGAFQEWHDYCDGPDDTTPNYVRLWISGPGPTEGSASGPGGLRFYIYVQDGPTSTPYAWAWPISGGLTRWELLDGGVRCWQSTTGYRVEVDAPTCST